MLPGFEVLFLEFLQIMKYFQNAQNADLFFCGQLLIDQLLFSSQRLNPTHLKLVIAGYNMMQTSWRGHLRAQPAFAPEPLYHTRSMAVHNGFTWDTPVL